MKQNHDTDGIILENILDSCAPSALDWGAKEDSERQKFFDIAIKSMLQFNCFNNGGNSVFSWSSVFDYQGSAAYLDQRAI